MRTAWFCEQDEFCRAVLAHHWPGVPCHPDITELRAVDVEPVDVLCGGFPCQDLSYAGAGAGLAGARSGLWTEYARLVGELRPRYVVVENVSALLARGLGTVLGDLAALGYDAEWDCIPASAVGAPHRRDRVWLVAYADGGRQRAQLEDVRPRQPNTARRGDEVADTALARLEGPGLPRRPALNGAAVADADQGRRARRPGELRPSGRGEPPHGGWWAVEPDVGRVAHGVPARVDRLAALGNALVPQIAEWIGRRIIDWEGGLTS